MYRYSQLVVRRTFLNGVLAAQSANAPRWVIDFLLQPSVRRRFSVKFPYRVASFFELAKYVRGFFGYARRGEWTVIRYFFKQAMARIGSAFRPRKPDQTKPMFAGAPGEVCFMPTAPQSTQA